MSDPSKHHAHPWFYRLALATLFGLGFCQSSASSPPTAWSDETYHYHEVTGERVKAVTWRLRTADRTVLTYTSPGECHTTEIGQGYETIGWSVEKEPGRTRLSARRRGERILLSGRHKGRPVDKVLEIDGAPWYQATSLSLRGLIASDDSERVFWTIRCDTLTAHRIKAIKKGTEPIGESGNDRLLHIRLTLPGLLAPLWKSDYWFTLPDSVFYRFEGPSGPPGSPLTVVTRLD